MEGGSGCEWMHERKEEGRRGNKEMIVGDKTGSTKGRGLQKEERKGEERKGEERKGEERRGEERRAEERRGEERREEEGRWEEKKQGN